MKGLALDHCFTPFHHLLPDYIPSPASSSSFVTYLSTDSYSNIRGASVFTLHSHFEQISILQNAKLSLLLSLRMQHPVPSLCALWVFKSIWYTLTCIHSNNFEYPLSLHVRVWTVVLLLVSHMQFGRLSFVLPIISRSMHDSYNP